MRMLAALVLLLQDAATLELKFKKGDKVRYVQSLESSTEHGTVRHETAYTMEVLDVGDGGKGRVRTTFDRFKVEMTGAVEKSFDSAKEEDLKQARGDQALKMYAALTGKSIQLLVNSKGKIEQSDLSELVQALEADDDFKTIVATAKKIGPDMMQHSFCALPAGPVKPGDTWKDSRDIEIPGVGKVVMAGTYTFEGLQDGRATIGVDMAITLEKDPKAAGPFDLKEGAGKGAIVFDVAAGNILSSKTATRLSVERASKTGQTQSMTLNQKSETRRQ